jgi:carboxypeptidase C (cathepsin A)
LKYPEYLSSAKRHNFACRVLQEKIETFENANSNDENFNHLITSLYYLSGYIIECSLKFKIFEVFSFNSDLEIDEEAYRILGINKRKIQVHSFHKLQNFLDSKISDISHISNESAINLLMEQWNPIIRYQHLEIQYQEVKAFYNHANNFMKSM